MPDSTPRTVALEYRDVLFARAGAIGIGTLAADGELIFTPLCCRRELVSQGCPYSAGSDARSLTPKTDPSGKGS